MADLMNAITNLTNSFAQDCRETSEYRSKMCQLIGLDVDDPDQNNFDCILDHMKDREVVYEKYFDNFNCCDEKEALEQELKDFKTEYFDGLEKLKNENFNLSHQLQMVKDCAEYKEYQELFTKKQKIETELTSLKNSKSATSSKYKKIEDENNKLIAKNEKLEQENDELNFVSKKYLDKNMRYTKKQLCAMLEHQAKLLEHQEKEYKKYEGELHNGTNIIIAQKHYYREQCNVLLNKINKIYHDARVEIDAGCPS